MATTVDAGLIGLLWVLGLGSVTTALSLILFDILRPRIPDVYDRRRRVLPQRKLGFPVDDGRHDSPASPSFRPFSWIPYTWRLSDDLIKEMYGLDVLMLLRFFYVMAKFSAHLAFFTTLILVPIYATASNKDLPKKNPLRVIGIRILSLANVPANNWRMIIVFLADLAITVYVLRTIAVETRYLIKLRREYRSSDHPSNYTVILQDVPSEHANPDNLHQFWESLFPDQIETIKLIPSCSKVNKYRREYWNAVNRRQRAQAILREQQNGLKKKASGSSSTQGEQEQSASSMHPQSFFNTARRRLSLFGAPSLSISRGDSGGHIEQTSEIQPPPSLLKIKSLRDKLKLTSGLLSFMGPEECIHFWETKEEQLLESIQNLSTDVDIVDKSGATKAAILVFKKTKYALLVAQANLTASRRHWNLNPAPDVKAIDWKRFGIPSRMVLPRKLLSFLLTACLIVFWVIPTALIQSLANIESLSKNSAFAWLGFVSKLPPELSGFVQGLLPAIVLEVVMIIIPKVIRWFVMFQRIPSKVDVEREVLQNMIAFLYFSHLIYVVLSGSLLEYSDEIIQNPSNIVKILATSIPQQGTFMMSVIFLATVIQTPLELLQPTRLLKRWIGMHRTWTQRDRELVNSSNSLVEHFHPYAFGTIFAVLGIVYSTITPVLLIFCAFFFVLSYIVFKFKLIFTFTQPWEGFAALHHVALNGVTSALIVKHLTMGGLMGLNGQAALATLEFLCAAATATIIVVLRQSLLPVLEYGAIADLSVISRSRSLKVQASPRKSAASHAVADVYKHPSYASIKPLDECHPL